MAIIFEEKDGGKVLEVHVSGKLEKSDYERFAPEVDRLVDRHGKIRVLFDMVDFHGWSTGAMLEDIKFAARHFSDIERLAVAGEKKWQKGMTRFCRPFTRAKIRYFDRSALPEARQWTESA